MDERRTISGAGAGPMGVLASAVLGAVLMYYFDPSRGRYRRALVRDRLVHAAHKLQAGLDAALRDMRNRIEGLGASLRTYFVPMPASDPVLAERVHAKIGRLVSHPGSIEVTAHEGVVTLSGPILAEEVQRLIAGALEVPGVSGVVDRLEVYASPEHVPGLQGGRPTPGERSAFFQTNWSPAARLVGGAAGASLFLYALRRRGPLRVPFAAAGVLVSARAATNLEVRRLLGIGTPRHAVEVQKAIRINAPAERVFAVWANFEEFPRIMTHVKRVRALDDGRLGKRWRWTVRGPSGIYVDFDTVITALEPNRLIAWRTEPGSPVQHAGQVQFHAHDDNATTVEVRMTYNPAAGALGHGVAKLFRADPKRRMNDDMLRLKTYIETGIAAHDAAAQAAGARPSAAGKPGGAARLVH
ncbi:MAG TPA: SRPBCC family protein [Burkholderiales bacterium]